MVYILKSKFIKLVNVRLLVVQIFATYQPYAYGYFRSSCYKNFICSMERKIAALEAENQLLRNQPVVVTQTVVAPPLPATEPSQPIEPPQLLEVCHCQYYR